MFLEAARALAGQVRADDLAEGAVYPELRKIRDCSHAVACATIRRAVEEGHADPAILEHLERKVERAMWYPEYLPLRYEPAGVFGSPVRPVTSARRRVRTA
jgi:malic enzyme